MENTIDILIENAVVMPVNADMKLIWDGAVAIKGKNIVDIGSSADLKGKYKAAKKINGKNKMVMPGMINAHTHISGALLRGMIDNLNFIPWVRKKTWVSSRALDEESYHTSAMLLCLEMLKRGTTCFVDCGTIQGMEQAAVDAIKKIGIKAILGRCIRGDLSESITTSDKLREADTEKNLMQGEDFIQKWNNAADGRVQAWLCPIIARSISDKLWRGAAELAGKYGVGLLTHTAVVPEDVEMSVELHGLTPVERLYRLGVLGPNFLGAHMGWITEQEMLLLKETQTNVVHVPSASMKCAYGSIAWGKFPELIAIGVNVSLGSDGPSASSFQDMVRTMHLVAGGFKEVRLDPRIMPPETVIKMATINGAKAVLWSDKIGSLEKGKRADIVMFDLMRPEWVPWNEKNLISNFVYSASGSSAEMVIIDGKIIMEDGVVRTVDSGEILETAQEASKKFARLSDEWDETVWKKPKT